MKKVMERPEIRIKVKKTQFRKGAVPWNKERIMFTQMIQLT